MEGLQLESNVSRLWVSGGVIGLDPDLAKQSLLFNLRQRVKACFQIFHSFDVIDIAVATPLFHVGHPAGDNPEEIGTGPDHHDQDKNRLCCDASRKPFETSRIERDIAKATQSKDGQADQQNLSSGQLSCLPDR